MANIMDKGTEYTPAGWDTMSLQHKEIMATRSILAVTEELYESSDTEGLKVLAQNLKSLSGWVEKRKDFLHRKLDIITRINSLLEHVNSKGIDDEFSENLGNIASLTTDFLVDESEEDTDNCQFSQAYCNLKALMEKEQADFEATWEAEQETA